MTSVPRSSPRPEETEHGGLPCSCDFASWRGHDELRVALNDLEATDILRLLEIVDEWSPGAEPNYPMPGEWPLFAAQHNWRDPMLVCRTVDWLDHLARLIRQHNDDARSLELVRSAIG